MNSNVRKVPFIQGIRVVLLFVIILNVFQYTEGFLGRGTYLENKGDIFNIYCKEFDKGTRVWHHREITREAVRRVIIKYFKEVPPREGVYNHRIGMTLEEAYQEYYGSKASPKPFLYSVGQLVDAVANTDTGNFGTDPRYHFGSERFSESQQYLANRWRRIVQAGLAGDYSSAIYLLGTSLGTIQDFYSHTNWIEIGNEKFNPIIGLPGMNIENVATPKEVTCQVCNTDIASCKGNLLQDIIDSMKLTSGYLEGSFVDGIRLEKPLGTGKCSHGGSKDQSFGGRSNGGINKELPTSCFSPHHHLHQQAAEQAIQATEHYLNLLRGAIGDAMFSRLLSLHPTPALVLVLDTTDSMDEELSALTQVVKNLLDRHSTATYPPTEYLLVPFNDPYFSGQVTRSQRPDEIYSALTKLRATGGGDEAEYSMSALREALQYSPPFSHVFFITDATIKDPELFDSVIALTQLKKIRVTPVLTMPVTFGGIIGRSSLPLYDDNNSLEKQPNNIQIDSHIRRKRHLPSFNKYWELARRSGGQLIETPSNLVEETSKIFEADQYTMALLWREDDMRYPREVKFPVDSLISEFEVSISGKVDSVLMHSPTGIRYDLSVRKSLDQDEYTLVAITPFLIQVRFNMTQRMSEFGEWSLAINPSDVTSVVVSARTSMDIAPAFYSPDFKSSQPSLQRILGQPRKGIPTYLDVVITGVDTAGLRSVKSAYLRSTDGKELLTFDLPTTSPRRNTYLDFPTERLTTGSFSVAVVGEDGNGHPFRRESRTVWELSESLVEFPLGREVWGHPGQNLTIPVIIRNTNPDSSNTFFVGANEAKGTPVAISQKIVTLEKNESLTLMLYMIVPLQTLPSSTSSLIVTSSSLRGDTSHALAHVSISPVFQVNHRLMKRDTRYNTHYNDQVAPTIEERDRTSCRGYLDPQNCNREWSVRFLIQDSYPGLLKVTMYPHSELVPPFPSGQTSLTIYYSSTCCQPEVTINAYDLALNVQSKTIDNRSDDAKLSAGAISGIVLGSVAGLILLLLLVVFIVRRLRNRKKKQITVRRVRRRSSSSE